MRPFDSEQLAGQHLQVPVPASQASARKLRPSASHATTNAAPTHVQQHPELRRQAESSVSTLLRCGVAQQGQQVVLQSVTCQLHAAAVALTPAACCTIGVPGCVPRLAVHAGVSRC